MAKIAIRTNRLVLRSFNQDDKDDMISILTNHTIKQTYMLPDFQAPEDATPLFDKLTALSKTNDRYVYGIALDGKIIGFMNDVEIKDSSIEVGYVIHPDYHNQGYATEALAALIDYLHSIGFSSVVAGYFEENPASGRVMEKAGMVKIAFTEEIEYRGKSHHCIYFEHRV